MKRSKTPFASVFSAGALVVTCLLALPQSAEAKGPKSRSLARYQRDQGLQETGNISSSLLQSLGLR